MEKLIGKILKIYKDELPHPGLDWEYDLTCALLYLRECLFSFACRVSRMKENCHTPGNNFSLRFRHRLGMTPAGYITHHRMEAAKRLLSDARLKEVPVSEIGFAVGYERASTFTSAFTKKEGMPPKVWRQQQLKKPKRISKKIPKRKPKKLRDFFRYFSSLT